METFSTNENNVINTAPYKIAKYAELVNEVASHWQVKAKILPVVVFTTRVLPHRTVKAVEKLSGSIQEIRAMQIVATLHTTSMVRKIIGDRMSNCG